MYSLRKNDGVVLRGCAANTYMIRWALRRSHDIRTTADGEPNVRFSIGLFWLLRCTVRATLDFGSRMTTARVLLTFSIPIIFLQPRYDFRRTCM